MIPLAKLREMPLFAELSEERMRWVCGQLQEVSLDAGTVLVREGEVRRGFFILVEGEIQATKHADGVEVPAGHHKAPAFFGEVPLLAQFPVPVTVRSVTASRLARLDDTAFRTLIAESQEFAKVIFQTMAARMSGMESFVRQREKMAALGKLAAGLAHELNNPAAAIARVVDRLRAVLDALYEAGETLQRHALNAQSCGLLEGLREAAEQRMKDAGTPDPIAASDREEELTDWLADHDVEKGWLHAATFAAAGVTKGDLETLRDGVSGEILSASVAWLAASIELAQLLDDAGRGATRISELVKALKSYSYEGQGPMQEIDLHDGIEDTLTILKHKLKHGIIVVRDYDRTLPKLTVFGSELNQVWTNLIDNAADAMNGSGTITIRTRRQGDYAVVEIGDNGPGIPKEIQPRIFEPFFTTKEQGKGSGLGLDIAYRSVVNRHRGNIRLHSQPGDTRFEVVLPIAGAQKS